MRRYNFICMKNDTLFPVNMGTNPDVIINIALSFFRRSFVAGIRDKRNSRQMIYNEVEHIKKEYLSKDINDSLIKKYLDEYDALTTRVTDRNGIVGSSGLNIVGEGTREEIYTLSLIFSSPPIHGFCHEAPRLLRNSEPLRLPEAFL